VGDKHSCPQGRGHHIVRVVFFLRTTADGIVRDKGSSTSSIMSPSQMHISVTVTKLQYKTLGFEYEPCQILGVVQRFGKHYSCHPQGEFLRTAVELFAETLDNS